MDLPTALGMDMIHCERQAKLAIEQSKGALQLIRGEVIMETYFDNLAAEVQETLQVSNTRQKLSMCSGNTFRQAYPMAYNSALLPKMILQQLQTSMTAPRIMHCQHSSSSSLMVSVRGCPFLLMEASNRGP